MVFSQGQDVPLSAIEQYLQGVKTIAPLLQEEEAQLLQRIELGKVELAKSYANADFYGPLNRRVIGSLKGINLC